jgi:hypothetical protein
MLDESTNATNWSKKYVAIDRVYRGTDNRNRLIYSDWRLSWAVSNIGYCCFNSNRWRIFGEGPGAFGFITITIAFSRNERSIRTTAHGAMILFSGALLLTPGFFTDFIGFLLLIPNIRTTVFQKMKERINTTESRF